MTFYLKDNNFKQVFKKTFYIPLFIKPLCYKRGLVKFNHLIYQQKLLKKKLFSYSGLKSEYSFILNKFFFINTKFTLNNIYKTFSFINYSIIWKNLFYKILFKNIDDKEQFWLFNYPKKKNIKYIINKNSLKLNILKKYNTNWNYTYQFYNINKKYTFIYQDNSILSFRRKFFNYSSKKWSSIIFWKHRFYLFFISLYGLVILDKFFFIQNMYFKYTTTFLIWWEKKFFKSRLDLPLILQKQKKNYINLIVTFSDYIYNMYYKFIFTFWQKFDIFELKVLILQKKKTILKKACNKRKLSWKKRKHFKAVILWSYKLIIWGRRYMVHGTRYEKWKVRKRKKRRRKLINKNKLYFNFKPKYLIIKH